MHGRSSYLSDCLVRSGQDMFYERRNKKSCKNLSKDARGQGGVDLFYARRNKNSFKNSRKDARGQECFD